jgi:hypothetical protein
MMLARKWPAEKTQRGTGRHRQPQTQHGIRARDHRADCCPQLRAFRSPDFEPTIHRTLEEGGRMQHVASASAADNIV